MIGQHLTKNDIVEGRLEHMDFERLYKILRLAAEAVVRDAPDTFDMGWSARDLAHETFSAFLNSSSGLGWSPARGPIEKFLIGVLWRKARTHLRRDRKVASSLDDPATEYPALSMTASVGKEIEFHNLREKIYEAVGADNDLRDLIAAAEETSGQHNVNQELAEILGKSVREVVNLKRRLLNNERVARLLWPKRERS